MSVRTVATALLAFTAACSPPDPGPPDAGPDAPPAVPRTDILSYKAIANPDLDLLFVIDDSPSMLDKQTSLKAAFPALVAQLSQMSGGVPNLHLGVISTDMGTKGSAVTAPGPTIGSGPGSCSGTGKNGRLQKGTASITDDYLRLDRSGAKNFTGTLADEFSAMASLGGNGCGFEQHLQALRTALSAGANPGFVRDSANLAVVILTDEDDCSLLNPSMLGPDSATLGPLQSFRCTRFGVECSPDDINDPGAKSGCKPRAASAYVEDIAPFRDALLAAKGGDARHVSLGVIAGNASPFAVELRTPPGGGTAVTALTHSCTYTTATGEAVADPAVRLQALTDALGSHGVMTSVCASDLTPAAITIASNIGPLVGDTCLPRAIAQPANCVVTETHDAQPGAKTEIPPCGAGVGGLCYAIVDDAACAAAPHQRLAITRSDAPAQDEWITLSCAL
jgi:hypothetical protein